jgi:putative heme iron utilization protein
MSAEPSDQGTDKHGSASKNVTREAREFLGGFRTLLMSTVGVDGVPDASYAPFVRMEDNAFYIYVSELSRHTVNLSAHPLVSILFIQGENEAGELFARKRLTFDCRHQEVARESTDWHRTIQVFGAKFGDIMELIRPLTDFKLFRVEPVAGVYVRGFAQAYRIHGAELESFREVSDVGP